jgi:ssDNA-specific exonuclease RecJ
LPGEEVDVLFQLNINEYQGTKSLQMLVQDIKYSEEYASAYKQERSRYEQIKNGAQFDESEDIIPTREDFASVYTLIRKEFRMGKTTFSDKTLLSLLRANGFEIGYIKLKYIIRILQELKICGVSELSDGFYSFDVYFNASKTSIEKSAILKKLRGQCRV